MIVSSVPSNRDLLRSDRCQTSKTKPTFSSLVTQVAVIVRNWRVMTVIRGNRACPTSLHQTRTSTSWVMSDPSSFLSITVLIGITRICMSSQTWYRIGVWSQHEEGERLWHVSSEKAGQRDSSRYSWNRRSQWVVRCDYYLREIWRCKFWKSRCQRSESHGVSETWGTRFSCAYNTRITIIIYPRISQRQTEIM